ncbi:MAG: sensor histidine kinase, partial [Solirubrobacteraceae bacterium]
MIELRARFAGFLQRLWLGDLVDRVDVGVCAVLLAAGVVITNLPENYRAGWLGSVVMPFAVLPLLARRRAPVLAAGAFAAGAAVSGLPSFDQIRCGFALPVALMIVFSLAGHEGLRRAVWGLALVLAGLVVLALTDSILDKDPLVFLVLVLGLCSIVWGGGRIARARELAAVELDARTRRLEEQRERTARVAVELERTRLATDLDIAARASVRAIVRAAEEGGRVAGSDPEYARALFARVESDGRETLNQMRGLLGVLRSDERAAATPRPTLAQLETLLADARAGGRVVEFVVEGERRSLPDGVELAAYRVLQHALVAVRG